MRQSGPKHGSVNCDILNDSDWCRSNDNTKELVLIAVLGWLEQDCRGISMNIICSTYRLRWRNKLVILKAFRELPVCKQAVSTSDLNSVQKWVKNL